MSPSQMALLLTLSLRETTSHHLEEAIFSCQLFLQVAVFKCCLDIIISINNTHPVIELDLSFVPVKTYSNNIKVIVHPNKAEEIRSYI